MPLMNPETGMKQCTACLNEKQNKAGETFFRNPSAKDGYSTICKDCRKLYNKKSPEYAVARVAKEAMEPAAASNPVRLVAPLEVPKSHSPEDIRRIEKQTGMKYAGSLPVGGKTSQQVDVSGGKGQKFHREDIDTFFTLRVPVFRKAD